MTVNATAALALFGASTNASTTGDAASAVLALKMAQKPDAETKGVAQEKKDPVTITALKQFQTAIGHAKDIKSALRDPRVLNVLLPAMGLADQMQYSGLVQRALLADPKDTKGLLASLDSRFKAAAETLKLKEKGLEGLKDPALQKTLTDGYLQYQYQQGLDDKNAGLSDALYFIKNAANASNKNIYNILGNSVMRRVVVSALGLPAQIAIQPVETQAAAITRRLNLAKLQDPKEVQKLAQRYVMNQAGTAAPGNSNFLVSLLA